MADSLPLLGIETFKEIHGYGVIHDSSTPPAPAPHRGAGFQPAVSAFRRAFWH